MVLIRLFYLFSADHSSYFYAGVISRAHLSKLCKYLQSFLKFNAPILHPRRKRGRIFPRTGIWSRPYFLRSTDGTVSTPFRKEANFLNSSVFRRRCFMARSFERTDNGFSAGLFIHLGLAGRFIRTFLTLETFKRCYNLTIILVVTVPFRGVSTWTSSDPMAIFTKLKICINIRCFPPGEVCCY